jgi:hypothetical protein
MADSDTGITRQGKAIFLGVIFIAWGMIGAIWTYYSDTDSLDIIKMVDASQNAIVHAVIWIGLGSGLILWNLFGPGSSSRKVFDDDENQRDEFKK